MVTHVAMWELGLDYCLQVGQQTHPGLLGYYEINVP